jgi:hypothetical protein
MKKLAKELGIDTSRLEPVIHEGCKYEGADPAPAAAAATAAQPAANTGNAASTQSGSSSSSGGNAAGGGGASSAGPAKLMGTATVAAGGCKKHWFGWLLLHGKSC